MKNKGFTIIELLGVMIILSMIVLLVFPKIINSVKSNKSGDEAIEKIIYSATSLYIDDNSDYYTKRNNKTYCIKIKDLVDNKNLKKPVKYKDKKDITNYMTVKATYNDGFDYEIVNNEDCIPTPPRTYQNGEIVYFNVDTGEQCNDYTETQSNTGVKSGCMKFYIFNYDGGDKVNLILDHNTTALIVWNSSGSNASGPNEVLAQLKTDTASWVGTETPSNYTMDQRGQRYDDSGAYYTIDYSGYKARLITAQEIATITGNTTYDEVTSTDYYWLDTNTTTESDTCTKGNTSGCKYGWLYDRISVLCTDYGCLNNAVVPSSSMVTMSGYWTASSLSSSSSISIAWIVYYTSNVCGVYIARSDVFGVRPVIEVLKSKLD